MFASGKAAAVSSEANYIEDVFSTYLYTGNSSTQTITNGIDLSGEGGLVWMKDRSAVRSHCLADTANGAYYNLFSDLTNGLSGPDYQRLTSFNSDGFSIGSAGLVNNSGGTYASWTFRKQPKFFDVVTYTGNGTAGRQIAHNLGSTPGCIIVKATSNTAEGLVYHQSLGNTKYLTLFSTSTAAADTWSGAWNDTSPTSTHFTVGSGSNSNADGWTFVAYLFAHDAGGFGLTGTDNVISCGSFTTDSSWNATVNLGYEPQFILFKSTSYVDNWYTVDTMRGWSVVGGENYVSPNLSNAEANYSAGGNPTATGFQINTGNPNSTYIYIAIRRGPMAVPTLGTSVFTPVINTGNDTAGTVLTAGFPVDLTVGTIRNQSGYTYSNFVDRLRGAFKNLWGGTDAAEFTDASGLTSYANQTGIVVGTGGGNSWSNQAPWLYVNWMFRRAPGFFDVVCYTGTNPTAQNINHNLGVVPELMIVKKRGGAQDWAVYATSLGTNKLIPLNLTDAPYTSTNYWNDTAPTASVFSVGNSGFTNLNATTYVAYLFATCPGVSKVGSYTGTGTTLQINCGFTGGARFVLIRRTDSTGDWYVWDSARGIVAGNDPYLLLNSTAAEVTSTDYIDTYSAGFEISSTAPAAINASGGTFIFLAIA